MTPRTAMVALAAKRLNRPVKLVATRQPGLLPFPLIELKRGTVSGSALVATASLSLRARRLGNQFPPDQYVVAGIARHRASLRVRCGKDPKSPSCMQTAARRFMRSPPMVPYMYRSRPPWTSFAVKLGMDLSSYGAQRHNDGPIEGKPF